MATLPRHPNPQLFLIEKGQQHDWSFEAFELFFSVLAMSRASQHLHRFGREDP
jgi:hypothetical protein